jgi:protocatechuate 3,4-dioxygenase beta subunit
MGITLPAPGLQRIDAAAGGRAVLHAGHTRAQLLPRGRDDGHASLLVGYVLDQNCQPLPNAWLDFWQAGADGEYDNEGYRLRGHQYTDSQGRYFLETVLPGLYSSRPIEHIHVKVRPEGGAEVTSQLYFPDRPVDGLTVALEERGDHLVGYFNFVVQR